MRLLVARDVRSSSGKGGWGTGDGGVVEDGGGGGGGGGGVYQQRGGLPT